MIIMLDLSIYVLISLFLVVLPGALGSTPWAKGFPTLNKIPISHIQQLTALVSSERQQKPPYITVVLLLCTGRRGHYKSSNLDDLITFI